MINGEGCQSFWGVVWDCNILDPTYKTDERPTKIQNDYPRPDRIWPEACTQLSKEQKEHILQNGHKKTPNCKQHGATEESTRYPPMTMITSETGKRYCSWYAVHCERQSRETSNLYTFNWCGWGTVRFRKYRRMRKRWGEKIWTTLPKKGMWEAFTVAWYTSQFLFKKLCRNQNPKLPWINKRKL